MTITSVRIYYEPEDVSLKKLSTTHWGFAHWFERRLKPIKQQLRGPEAKGVNIVNFMLYEKPEQAFKLNEWWHRANSFEFDTVYDLRSLSQSEPIENIKKLMLFTSQIALAAPWPQVVAVGAALAEPLGAEDQETLAPFLGWPRSGT